MVIDSLGREQARQLVYDQEDRIVLACAPIEKKKKHSGDRNFSRLQKACVAQVAVRNGMRHIESWQDWFLKFDSTKEMTPCRKPGGGGGEN